MKPIHDDCPEALPILSSQDFHLPSYEKGVTILCAHPAGNYGNNDYLFIIIINIIIIITIKTHDTFQ